MFKRLYILSFLRSIFIFLTITPMLNLYILTLIYRIPNVERERLVTYVCETGDVTYLKTPIVDYSFFYAILDPNGDTVYISDTSTQIEAKKKCLNNLKDIYYKSKPLAFYNIQPEDKSFHHMAFDNYYFTSKQKLHREPGYSVFYVIYNREEVSLQYASNQSFKANMICMIAASVISLIFAFFEVLPAKRAWNTQKQFIAQTSHELRTPTSVINSVLELFNTDRSEEDKKNYQIMKGEVNILIGLINGLMFLSRTDVKQIKLKKEFVEIYTLLLETYIAAEVLAEPKSIVFEDFKSDEAIILADDAMIRQVIMILLNNAIQYTQVGGKISLSCKRIGSKIEITVEDNGIGIDKKNMKLIFNRFYRVEKSKSSNKGNSGLGLAIAKWIVIQHRGNIRVESVIGKGSKFIVSLPAIR